MSNNKVLKIAGKVNSKGIEILVKGKKFAVEYPQFIWKTLPRSVKKVLKDNLIYAESNFLPLILNKNNVFYDINFPLLESFCFKNQIYDMPDVELEDKKKPGEYVRQFFNLRTDFKNHETNLIKANELPKFNLEPTVVLPFSFGKESLVTAAVLQELKVKQTLVFCQEPAQVYEEKFKLPLLKKIGREQKLPVHFIKNGPGLFRYDKAFGINPSTELGWGNQCTVLALQMIPFVYYYKANYILFGSEYSNNIDETLNGWLVNHFFDHTFLWTVQMGNMIRLLTGNNCTVKSSLESLDEITILYILTNRYPQFVKYYTSCLAMKPFVKGSLWCCDCYKCHKIYLLSKACGFDPKLLGFSSDLFQDKNFLVSYFKEGGDSDCDFAFYILYKKGVNNPAVQNFVDKFLKTNKIKSWQWHVNFFLKLKKGYNMPSELESKMYKIFEQELNNFKKYINAV